MGMIINIDQALNQRTEYNVLKEPLNAMLMEQQEAWERENPVDMLFVRRSIGSFQETYTSTIGFDHAFSETADYTVSPIFNTAEGFAATFRTRTFQGSFIISQQVLEDGQAGAVKDTATQFMRRWHGDIVEYCMTALAGGFGEVVEFTTSQGTSRLKLDSADTTDGKIDTPTKNPLFSKKHTTVARDGNKPMEQSNAYYVLDGEAKGIDLLGSDPGSIAKLADVIDQVITNMENYLDDNGKIAGVTGAKTIVAPNDARLKSALSTALSMESLCGRGDSSVINPAYQKATLQTSPYLNYCAATKNGIGFFVIDKAYNASNHGLELTERIPLTLDVQQTTRPLPRGIIYDGRQRFDVNVATWRGIAYVYIGKGEFEGLTALKTAQLENHLTAITPVSTLVKPVTIVGEVKTSGAGA